MSRLLKALQKKYATPRECLKALGLDTADLDADLLAGDTKLAVHDAALAAHGKSALLKTLRSKLAKDATIAEVAELLDLIDSHKGVGDDEEPPRKVRSNLTDEEKQRMAKYGSIENKSAGAVRKGKDAEFSEEYSNEEASSEHPVIAHLKTLGIDDEEIEKVRGMLNGGNPDDETEDEESDTDDPTIGTPNQSQKTPISRMQPNEDSPPPFQGMKFPGGKKRGMDIMHNVRRSMASDTAPCGSVADFLKKQNKPKARLAVDAKAKRAASKPDTKSAFLNRFPDVGLIKQAL